MSETDHYGDGTERTAEKFVEKIRDALDIDEDDELVVQTPQFERPDDVEPAEPPLTHEAMDALKRADKDELDELGLSKWSDETGLWLLPHEWHPHIPEDYPLLSILNEWTTRADMSANPDKRFGVLSVGIVPNFERPLQAETGRSDGGESDE